jgi:aspartyl-tRNA(Asn)/glutamyl-tRNA(Gln) amidotransferase subunit C
MKVTEKDVRYVEELANLELTPDERNRMITDLNSILNYVDRLNELDTADVPPMAQVAAGLPPMREDQVDATGQRLERPAVMPNAPDTDGTFFKVPKVIEK